MRKRSDKKRQAILDAAYGLFSEKGFEGTSMSEIRARAGGSKATIYRYFRSKEQLFVECVFSVAERYLEEVFCERRNPVDDPSLVLRRFGERFLRSVCSPEMIAVRRLMIAEADRAGIGRLFYDKMLVIRQQITSFLTGIIAGVDLFGDKADLAASQFRALLEAEFVEPRLLCACIDGPDEQTIVLTAERAVGTFLHAYSWEERSS